MSDGPQDHQGDKGDYGIDAQFQTGPVAALLEANALSHLFVFNHCLNADILRVRRQFLPPFL